MIRNEIGSEFWTNSPLSQSRNRFPINIRFSLTGRTALVHILEDILFNRKVKTALLPDYLCHTMIIPFLEKNIKCYFYHIIFHDGEFQHIIEQNQLNVDIMLIMDYFGFRSFTKESMINKALERNIIIIEDMTHSVMSNLSLKTNADYSFASLRKWTGIPAGAILHKNVSFNIPDSEMINDDYIRLREKGFKAKKEYMNTVGPKEKKHLLLFDEAEKKLDENYFDYTLPQKYIRLLHHLDYQYICDKRKQNGSYLIENLKEFVWIQFPRLQLLETPLFIPIFLETNMRDSLRKKLIENNIFCPTHWPNSKFHSITTDLVDNELSLVCDQRYSIKEMERIIETIKECEAEFWKNIK